MKGKLCESVHFESLCGGEVDNEMNCNCKYCTR